MNTRTLARAATAGAAATLLATAAVVAGAPLAASAHVRVDPGHAAPGSYTTLTFKVPNESATASTVRVEVDLPADTPFTSVSYQPVPGWSASVVVGTLPSPITAGDATITEAPLSVVWTADAGTAGVAPGQFQEFPLSVGPVPDTAQVVLPAHQGYSDGSTVDWAEPTPASGEEPEHPAPTLYITSAPPADGVATVTAGAEGGSPDASDASGADGTASLALGFGIGGLALGTLALVLAAVAVLRRPGSPDATDAQ
ncbi:YcnI family protein [Herbiconiux sp. CPCC 205763]|uniref:YcnI family protein n=1 Tax=Herbiconiux aconitum TaxID=2970913 RepID=A0ABT2GRD3_9MICO|nr:YcnI family protein [Herbiconiux aconitum]MCS5717346.1 YcnI family protein [Herbiconiux aconitum]